MFLIVEKLINNHNVWVYLLSSLPFSLFFFNRKLKKKVTETYRTAREKMGLSILFSFITALLSIPILISYFAKGTGSYMLFSSSAALGWGLFFLLITLLLIFNSVREWRKMKRLAKI